jgi:hypothetical protein
MRIVEVEGRVIGRGGSPLSGATVLASGGNPIVVEVGELPDVEEAGLTAAGGRYSLEMPAGPAARVVAFHPEHGVGASDPVTEGGELSDLELAAIVAVTGRIVVPDQGADSPLRLRLDSRIGDLILRSDGRVDEDGGFEVSGVAGASATVVFRMGDASYSKSIRLDGSPLELVPPAPTAALTGRFELPAGQDRARLQLEVLHDGWLVAYSQRRGTGGIDLGRVVTGDALFLIDYHRVPARITGDLELELACPDGGVRGRMPRSPGRRISLSRVDGLAIEGHPEATGQPQAVIAEDGTFEIDGLVAGEYQLHLEGVPGQPPQPVGRASVSAGELVDLGELSEGR